MAIGAAIGATTYIVGQLITGNSICAGELAISAGEGALTAVTGTVLGAAISGVASFVKSFREGNDLGDVLLDTAIGVGSSLVGSGSKMIGGRVKFTEFKNTATKRQLKVCGNYISGMYGNQYKNVSNWATIDKDAVKYFSRTKYASYLGYLGSCGTSVSANIVRNGARGPR